ncbi:MAG: 3-deoxy-7-phosphoheptulonate synthase [Bdellovibrionaceae bacterium]|nr:3-deoxy-7-phosphoheptulonate synthase [Pseudobdellovibrionaceae bacterium]|tara:strand:+ start:2265 stop:3380 length:1116 start_codon:yes stop_codon:yes gene_type:complete
MIGDLRKKIDQIDNQILDLLEKRARLAIEAGVLKKDKPIYDPKREKEILDSIENRLPGVFPKSTLRSVFREIISGCRQIQENSRLENKTKKTHMIISSNDSQSWIKVSRSSQPEDSEFNVKGVILGGDDFVVIAGPCSIESKEQSDQVAQAVRSCGAKIFRGGAFKPRTSPYSFQGLGWDGIDILSQTAKSFGMPSVSEVTSIDQVERMASQINILQVGARNMQNFDLLKALGKTDNAILLKRGLSATIEEFLAAAEYIVSEGNPHVILCERGIRTFEPSTRNTLDLSAVPILKERSHLPVFVDPSHGVGIRRWIRPLCRAAKAVGAHGIMLEVHPDPENAKSDADQALSFEDFELIMDDLSRIPKDHTYR